MSSSPSPETETGFERALARRDGSAGGTGCVVWDAVLVLARFLEERAEDSEAAGPAGLPLRRKVVLKLGAGIGLVGLMAASLGYVATAAGPRLRIAMGAAVLLSVAYTDWQQRHPWSL